MTKHWTFEDSDFANNFGEHVRSQLPWYDLATGLVRCIAENYLPENGVMYDIGSSTGNITKCCRDIIKDRQVDAVSIDPSQEMVDAWEGEGVVQKCSAEAFEYAEFDLAVMFLSMMFVTPSNRKKVMQALVDKMKSGGAIVVVDKFNPCAGYFATVMRRMTLRQKLSAGESKEGIINKELSLSGIQRPLDYSDIDGKRFFQVGEFSGFVITGQQE